MTIVFADEAVWAGVPAAVPVVWAAAVPVFAAVRAAVSVSAAVLSSAV